jgi:hypothetical protein
LYTTTPAPKTPSPHAMTKFAPIPQSHLLACYKPKRCKQISLVDRSHDGDDNDDDDDDDDDDGGGDAAAAVAVAKGAHTGKRAQFSKCAHWSRRSVSVWK